MFFFLQEKNNDDRVSFYTPQIISDMITQSVCDELDDSNVLIGKDRTLGRGIVESNRETVTPITGDIRMPANGDWVGNGGLNILISTSVEKSGKNFSEIHYSHKEFYQYAHMLSDAIFDYGKIVTFNHEGRKPRLAQATTKKLKKAQDTPYISIFAFNIYSPNLLDYLRQINMLTQCLAETLEEMC